MPLQNRPIQYSLAGLFALLTACSLVLGYVRFVGVWRFVLALGPPLLAPAVFNVLMSPDSWFAPPILSKRREIDHPAPDAVRVLTALVLGFLVWLPVLLILNWR